MKIDRPVLAHSRVIAGGADPSSWLYLLHGIYGSGRNWGSLARRLVTERRDWGVVLVDLRLHGESTNFPPPHTLTECATDVVLLEETLGIPARAILGHSYGGKVALLCAAGSGGSIRQAWIADSTLRVGAPSGSAWSIIEIVRTLPEDFASRDEVTDALVAHGYARGVGHWLGMNLARGDDGRFRWKLDWIGVEEMLRDYFAVDVWGTVERPPDGVEIHLVKAGESEALDDQSVERITEAGRRTGRVHLHLIEGGHWINVDNPEAMLALLRERL